MDGRGGPLLLSVEDDGAPRRRRVDEPERRPGRGGRRGAALLLAGAVGVGLVLTRTGGGSEDRAAPTSTTTTTAQPTSTIADPPEPLDTPRPRLQQRSTTTSPVAPQRVLGALLSTPTGATLVTLAGGDLAVIEIDTGTVTAVELRRSNPFLAASSGDRVVVVTDEVEVIDTSEGTQRSLLGLGGAVWPSARPGYVWVQLHSEPGGIELVEVAVDGTGTASSTVLPAVGEPVVGPGGVLVNALGTVVLWDPERDQGRVVGDGRGLGIAGRRLLRVRCGGDLVCGLRVSELDGAGDRGITLPPGTPPLEWAAALPSPDARHVVLSVPPVGREGRVVLLVDAEAATAEIVAEVDAYAGSPAAFSPDGRWLFVRDGDALSAIEVSTGELTGLPDLDLGWTPDGTILALGEPAG